MLANKPYVIGLTGGIGCGKSEAAQYLKSLGAAHVDADEISHALTAEGGVRSGKLKVWVELKRTLHAEIVE